MNLKKRIKKNGVIKLCNHNYIVWASKQAGKQASAKGAHDARERVWARKKAHYTMLISNLIIFFLFLFFFNRFWQAEKLLNSWLLHIQRSFTHSLTHSFTHSLIRSLSLSPRAFMHEMTLTQAARVRFPLLFLSFRFHTHTHTRKRIEYIGEKVKSPWPTPPPTTMTKRTRMKTRYCKGRDCSRSIHTYFVRWFDLNL